MKFFPFVLVLLFVLGRLQGLSLPEKKLNGGLNTTLLANFSGFYEKRNPCNNEKLESRSYVASHEFHHHNKGGNWNDYTEKCSIIISNFLKSISNLITFNNKNDGTFTFHVNTSISQNQANPCNSKEERPSLPTIIIEATSCVNPEQSRETGKGLIKEKSKEEVTKDEFQKQKLCQNLEKTFDELSAISQESLASSNTIREKAIGLDMETEGPIESVTTFEATQSTEPETFFSNTDWDNSKEIQERVQFANDYVSEQPSMTPVNARETFMSQADAIAGKTETSNLGLSTPVEIKPSGTFEAVTDISSAVSQSSLSSNSARVEEMNVMLPTDSFTQQRTTPIYNRLLQSSQNENPNSFSSTFTPIISEKSETIEETTAYDSKKRGSLNVAKALQPDSFNDKMNPTAKPSQPAESSDYLKKQDEFNFPEIENSGTNLPARIPPPEEQSRMLQPPEILPNGPFDRETSSVESQTRLDNENLFNQEFIKSTPQPLEDYNYPADESSSYSQYDTDLTTLGEQDDQYYTTFPPNRADDIQNMGVPPFPADERPSKEANTPAKTFELSNQKRENYKINRKGNNNRARPQQNLPPASKVTSSYQITTPVMQSAESYIKSSQDVQFGIKKQRPPMGQYREDVMDQFRPSKSPEKAYAKVSETTADDNQNYPKPPVYGNAESYSGTGTVLNEENFQSSSYSPITPQPMPYTTIFDEETVKNFDSEDASQFADLSEQSQLPEKPLGTEPTTHDVPVTYSPQNEENPSKQIKPDTYPSQVSNYERKKQFQDNRFVSESSDSMDYGLSESFSTKALPVSSEGETFQESSADYNDFSDEQSRARTESSFTEPLENFNTTPYSSPNSEIRSTGSESGTSSYSQQNQLSEALSTGIYDSYTTLAPRLLEPNTYKKFGQQNLLISDNYNTQSNTSYETDNNENFDSFTVNYPTVSEAEVDGVSLKPTEYSPSQLPLTSTRFLKKALKTTEETSTLDESEYQTTPLPNFQQPFRSQTNISNRNRFPIKPQNRATEQFAEIVSDSSDAYSQQTSSTKLPSPASEVAAINDRRNAKIRANFRSENAFSSAESFSEKHEYDDVVSSQNTRTQIPQPQPSFDYPDDLGQLSNNERELSTASKGLKTSKLFDGSEQNFQIPVTYSPQPSFSLKTVTTKTLQTDNMANEYPLPLQVQPESTALTQNIEVADDSEFNSNPTYDDQVTPLPFSTVTAQPPEETETFFQELSTTPLPNTIKYDQEIITFDDQQTPSPSSVTFVPVQLLSEKEGRGLLEGDSAAIQREERPAIRATTPLPFFESSKEKVRNDRTNEMIQRFNSNREIVESNTKTFPSTTVIEKKYDENEKTQSVRSSLPVKSINNQPATVPYPQNFALIPSTISPSHTTATFDERVITSDNSKSLTLSAAQAQPLGYSQDPTGRFEGQRRRFSPQPPTQFYPEYKSLYYPPQGFSPDDNRRYGNNPQPMQFNPQAPRPRSEDLDNPARNQYNRFPSNFQRDQFESEFPAPNRFNPRVDAQNDQFLFPPNYGHRYSPNERPNFSYIPPSRPGMNSEHPPLSRVPPNFLSYQRENVFNERNAQYQSYEAERSANGNFNGQLIPPPNAQNYEPVPYYPRNDYNERFGNNYESQYPSDQMMPPFRNQPAGYFNTQERNFLNNSSQQVENRYQRPNFRMNPTTENQKVDVNQASSEVLGNYEERQTGMAFNERQTNFDEEMMSRSPKKESSFERTETQVQNTALYNSRDENGSDIVSGQLPGRIQQDNHFFNEQNSYDVSFSNPPGSNPVQQPEDNSGPWRSSLPNQFRSISTDFHHQPNANFVNPQNPNGGSEGSNTSQSDSYALGPGRVAPSRESDPTSRRRFNNPRSYARPIAAPETYSNG